jgi:hypothetical protein
VTSITKQKLRLVLWWRRRIGGRERNDCKI